jgi:hypothetical protein
MAVTGLSPTIQKQLTTVKNNLQHAKAWQALGDLLAESGDVRRGAGCYRRVLSLRPGDPVAQANLDKLVPNLRLCRFKLSARRQSSLVLPVNPVFLPLQSAEGLLF